MDSVTMVTHWGTKTMMEEEGGVPLANITPVKCAVRFTPPMLILVYKDEKTGECAVMTHGFTFSCLATSSI